MKKTITLILGFTLGILGVLHAIPQPPLIQFLDIATDQASYYNKAVSVEVEVRLPSSTPTDQVSLMRYPPSIYFVFEVRKDHRVGLVYGNKDNASFQKLRQAILAAATKGLRARLDIIIHDDGVGSEVRAELLGAHSPAAQ